MVKYVNASGQSEHWNLARVLDLASYFYFNSDYWYKEIDELAQEAYQIMKNEGSVLPKDYNTFYNYFVKTYDSISEEDDSEW